MPVNIDPAQPEGLGEYPITKLIPSHIVTFTNQADYTAKTGKPCPSWNSALPVKLWIDTAKATGSQVTYNTAHLDASFQHPVVTQIQVPSFLVGVANIPPDSGQYEKSSGGEYLTPIRALLPNEKLFPHEMGLFNVVNTDIYDPTGPAPSTGGGFTEADRAMLLSNYNMLVRLLAASGIAKD